MSSPPSRPAPPTPPSTWTPEGPAHTRMGVVRPSLPAQRRRRHEDQDEREAARSLRAHLDRCASADAQRIGLETRVADCSAARRRLRASAGTYAAWKPPLPMRSPATSTRRGPPGVATSQIRDRSARTSSLHTGHRSPARASWRRGSASVRRPISMPPRVSARTSRPAAADTPASSGSPTTPRQGSRVGTSDPCASRHSGSHFPEPNSQADRHIAIFLEVDRPHHRSYRPEHK